MHFPHREHLRLACTCEQVIAGKLHPDGRRYLPTVVLRLTPGDRDETSAELMVPDLLLGVVDRHHRLAPEAVGRAGFARLVVALSTVRLQTPPFRQGFAPEAGWQPGGISLNPQIAGRVAAVYTWEVEQEQLPYAALYTELALDVGYGTVGVRTSLTAPNLAEALGTERLQPGDWVTLDRSRIDLLEMEGL